MRGCTIRCAQSHFEQGECPRKDFAIPRFGERFAGVNYPLTMAVALAGGAVQRPLGLMIADNSWDYFSEPGKDALEFLEEDPALRWRHWSPDSFSFTATLRRAGERKGKGKRKGHARLRTENQPWGVDRLSRDDQVIVRQENKMAKRCLKGLEAADRQGGFAALLHPYDSLLWRTEEVEEIRSRPGSMVSSCSFCCFGGRKASWISLLHNSPRVHQALHHPRYHCARSEESGVHPSWRSGPGETRGTEEYPWRFCVAYAGAVVADLRALMIPPLGTAQFDLPHLSWGQPEECKVRTWCINWLLRWRKWWGTWSWEMNRGTWPAWRGIWDSRAQMPGCWAQRRRQMVGRCLSRTQLFGGTGALAWPMSGHHNMAFVVLKWWPCWPNCAAAPDRLSNLTKCTSMWWTVSRVFGPWKKAVPNQGGSTGSCKDSSPWLWPQTFIHWWRGPWPSGVNMEKWNRRIAGRSRKALILPPRWVVWPFKFQLGRLPNCPGLGSLPSKALERHWATRKSRDSSWKGAFFTFWLFWMPPVFFSSRAARQ